MSSPPRRLLNAGIMRSSTQPAISFPMELANYNALVNLSPIHLHDDSGIESHNEALHQPHLFGSQRNSVQSLQTIPHIARPPQFIFRQNSMRGSRMLQFPSIQEVAEPSPYEQVRVPSRTEARTVEGGVIVPIERLDEESRTEGTTPTDQPESQNETGRQEEQHEQQPDSQEQRIKKAAKFRVCIQFFFNMILLLCYTMIFLWLNNIVPINAVFGIAFGLILVAFVGPISKKGIYSDFDHMDTFFSIIHLTCLSVYAVIAFLKVNGVGISLTQFALLGMLVLFCACCKNSVDEPSASKAILLIGKVFLWIQLLAIAIKVDGLPIPWSTIFIPTYFVLVLLTFSSTLIIMGSLFAFFNIMREEGVSAELVVGSIWYILNALYTVVWLLVMAGLTDILDYGADNKAFKTYLLVGMIHSGVLMLFTLILWKIVLKFQEFEVQSEMLISDDEVEVEEHEGTSVPNTRIRFQVSKDDKTRLAMISSTFYTYLEKHMQNNADTNNPSTIKREIQQTKMRKKSNGLALSVPHHTDITPTRQNYVASPERKAEGKNLDFSEGDIKVNIPPPPEMKREESNRSNNENSCIVCCDSVPNAVFMDCGHGGVCYECALESWKKSDNCLICRHPINKILKIVHCKPLNITKVVESTTKVIERV